jgi:rhodanese-related sulfurtransferase
MLKLLAASATAALFALTLAPTPAHACGGDKTAKAEKTESAPDKLSAEQLKEMMADKKAKVTVLDVNSDDTRKSNGVIPGAVLLTSYKDYAATELPQDKESKLVFYCASTRCGASTKAAKRALTEGYTDVAVLPVGIKGWVAKGYAVDKKVAKKNS